MIRVILASVLTMGWCIALSTPELPPDPDAPPDVMPASCAPTSPDPHGYDRKLYALAGQGALTAADRAAIAKDDLATLRYLIRAVRRRGRQPPLPLAFRSRPLLHALNALTPLPNRKRLSKAHLTSLYSHYGPQAAIAVALARRNTRADPVLAELLRIDGASLPGLAHMQHCAQLKGKRSLKAQCGQPLARHEVPLLGRNGAALMWPAWGDRRLPGCESDAALAKRLMKRLPEWRKDPAQYADPVWRACYAGLAQHLAPRGDDRVDREFLETVYPDGPRYLHRLADVRAHGQWTWSRWTFENALLALSPSNASYSRMVCSCLSLQPYQVDAHPPLGPSLL